MSKIRGIAAAFSLRLISAHIPLFMVGDVSRISSNGANDCNQQVASEETEQAGVDNRSLTRCNQLVWVCLPYLIEGDLGVVACKCWIQVELKFELLD